MKVTAAISGVAIAAVALSHALVGCGSESKSNQESRAGMYPAAHSG